jgi:hypothetical protein
MDAFLYTLTHRTHNILPIVMNDSEIRRLRLSNQQIDSTTFHSPHDLVAWFGAMQAQDYTGAKWSIGARLPGLTNTDVEDAINRGEIVRTWPMRGTIHFVAAEDVQWLLALTGPRAIKKATGLYIKHGLTDQLANKAFLVLRQALHGSNRLERTQIMKLWEDEGIPTNDQRGYLLLGLAAQKGLICLGPMRGKQQTFVLLDEWVPIGEQLAHDDALAELTLRYFTAHGPATIKDFSWWTGLTLSDIKRGIEMVSAQLAHTEIGSQTYWFVPSAKPHPKNGRYVSVLSGFDEYLLGYADRSAALEDAYRYHLYTKNAVYPSTLLIDGQVKGVWRRTVKKNEITVTVTPFSSLSTAKKTATELELEHYGRFWGLPTVISWQSA